MDPITKSLIPEKGGFGVLVAFTDYDGAAVTPVSATWTLSDTDGNVINGRNQVAITSLSTSVTIVLSGDDLALSAGAGTTRVLTVEYVFNSKLGNNLPNKKQGKFEIEDLVAVVS